MGFDEDIKGFKNGYEIAPVIGSIPYVSYILKRMMHKPLQHS